VPAVRPAAAASGNGLLIWGRIINGAVILEPAFVVQAPARLPAAAGPHRVEGFDAAGGRVFSLAFEGELVADLPSGDERHFAYVVPLSATERSRIASIRLTGNGLTANRLPARAQLSAAGAPAANIAGTRAGQDVSVRWNPAYPIALVRDARTGAILSFARGGSVRVPSASGEITVDLSDGIGTLPRVTVRAP
jgi:hypothetical protein